MADSSKLSYTATKDGNLITSNFGSINPSLSGSTIVMIGEHLGDLVDGNNVFYATRTDTTKIIVTQPEEGSDT